MSLPVPDCIAQYPTWPVGLQPEFVECKVTVERGTSVWWARSSRNDQDLPWRPGAFWVAT